MGSETPEKPSAAWTDEAKFQFLMRIVAQLKEDGRIKWEKINLPGRTVKSLQNMWAKLNKQMADIEAQENHGEPAPSKTPRKRGPPKKTSKAVNFVNGAVDDDLDIKQKLLKKRRAEALDNEEPDVVIKRAKIKAEADDAVRLKKENYGEY
ncbi:hypothetical protein GGI43DRAFT_385942 [Trichoderma evansii]